MIFQLSYTKMSSAARCPRYYYYDRELGIESESKKLGMKFGSAGHAGLNTLYMTKDLGKCLEAATTAWIPFEGQDVNKDGKPGVRTLTKLKEILTAYHEQFFVGEDWTDAGGEKLEEVYIYVPYDIQQKMLVVSGNLYTDIRYLVKVDRKGLSGDVPAIQEFKFLKPIMGSDFVPEPNNQIVGYLKASKCKKAIVTVAKVQVSSVKGMVKGKLKSDEPHSIFTRDPVFYEEHVFKEFEQDAIGWTLSILTWKASNYWPKAAPDACNDFGGCQFRNLCAVSPEQRRVLLDLGFKKKKPYEKT